jgi:hypothetical protein
MLQDLNPNYQMQLDSNEELHEEDLYYTNEAPKNDNIDN